jgi:hypothetical protein
MKLIFTSPAFEKYYMEVKNVLQKELPEFAELINSKGSYLTLMSKGRLVDVRPGEVSKILNHKHTLSDWKRVTDRNKLAVVKDVHESPNIDAPIILQSSDKERFLLTHSETLLYVSTILEMPSKGWIVSV